MDKHREYIKRLMLAVNNLDGIYYQGLKSVHINDKILILLYALDDGKPRSQKQICEEWLIPKTTLNTIIRKCKTEAYISLEPLAGRKREMNVRLTPKGKAYAEKALKSVYAAENEAIKNTLEQVSPEFIASFELFNANLKSSFEKYRLLKGTTD